MRTIKMCIDTKMLPPDMIVAANRVAVDLGLADPDPYEMAVTRPWRKGSTLSVRFLGGDKAVQERVEHYAHQWEQHANIKFKFVTQGPAVLRIAFIEGAGSWSYMGTSNVLHWFNQHAPTMNYGWLTPSTGDIEYSRVVLHEFGHALGCIHEHQHPQGGVPWDKEKAYAYYAQNGWTPEEVDFQVFKRYNLPSTQYSQFDPQSIMMYPVPEDITVGDFSVGWNTELSETDKAFIGTIYPFD